MVAINQEEGFMFAINQDKYTASNCNDYCKEKCNPKLII